MNKNNDDSGKINSKNRKGSKNIKSSKNSKGGKEKGFGNENSLNGSYEKTEVSSKGSGMRSSGETEIKRGTSQKNGIRKEASGKTDRRKIALVCSACAAFLIPVIILLAVFKSFGFYPFGDRTLFIMDMKGEYLEYYASLRYLFTEKGSIFFNWSKSMGGNYIGLFAFYIASPLSFLTVLFPLEHMDAAIVVLTLLKTGLAGLSFYFLGNYILKKNSPRSGITGMIMVIPFSVSYALISYNILYQMCLMWLDGVIMLPLIILGLEKIFDGKKGILYIISISMLFISNYYTGYMAGIFTAMYFLFREVTRLEKSGGRRLFREIWRFFSDTVLAVCIAAPVILPTYLDLKMGKLSDQTYRPDTKYNYAFAKVFSKFKNGVYDSITNTGLPGIYAGYAVTVLAVIFIIFAAVNIRERAGALVIIFIILYSFCNTKIDEAWHGFQYPNWFPYRYAFVFSFFMVYMALRAAVWVYDRIIRADKLRIHIGINGIRYVNAAIAAALLIFVSVDMGINAKALYIGLDNEFHYTERKEFTDFLAKNGPLVKEIRKDKSFYRVNQQYEFSKNDALFYGYNGMTHYSSTYNVEVNKLTSSLGLAQTYIWNSGYGSNMMLDSLFSVKYLMDDSPVPASYETLDSSDSATLYRNSSALSIAYSAPVSSDSPDLEGNPYYNLNSFMNAVAGTGNNYFSQLPAETAVNGNETDITFTAVNDDPVYLYTGRDMSGYADVYVNDQRVGGNGTSETACSLYLGSFENGTAVTVRITKALPDTSQIAVGLMDSKLVTDTLSGLSEGNMKINSHHGGKLTGTVTIKPGEKLMTSIPYDKGWTMKVDGKKTKFTKFANTFIMADIGDGEHTVEFSYVSPGFTAGIVFAAAAVMIMIFYGSGLWLKVMKAVKRNAVHK